MCLGLVSWEIDSDTAICMQEFCWEWCSESYNLFVGHIFLTLKMHSNMHCMCGCMPSCIQLFATLWTAAHQLLCPWDSPGKNTGVGCHTLFQDIFPTRDQSPVSCITYIGRQVLYTSATWKGHTGYLEWSNSESESTLGDARGQGVGGGGGEGEWGIGVHGERVSV